ncbi:hypothetical protein N9045_00290 [bacterium]|nr:hypothetical protein [bacterium]
MAQNQNTSTAQSVKMDSRKFLGALNDSAQARIAFFENRIASMGKHVSKNYRLVSLHSNTLFFEDVDSNLYFAAEHTKEKGGKVSIENIKPIQIVEEEKQDLFSESCYKLVNAIEENDQKGMGSAYKRMQAQRFSGRAVPFSGVVKGRDNVIRHINVTTGESLDEGCRARLISTIVEGMKDHVIVENGHVVAGHFNGGNPVKLPVTKWAARKLVARKMRDVASNAYWSEGFQQRIKHTASLVAEGNVKEAVKVASVFLDENEEFTLLTSQQMKTLVENALAANAVLNDSIVRDTATLMHRTNLKISRNKIIDEWRNIAKKAEHPVLAENVAILEEVTDFEPAYDKFLNLIFEAFSNKEVAATALATTLESLKESTPKIKESFDLASKLDNLINRLQARDFDDAAIFEAEDLIATIQEELAANETLGDFDQMPGDDPLMDMGGDADSSQPVININSPLIQIGGKSSAGGEEEELDELQLPDQDELDAVIGQQAAPAAAPAPQQPAPAPAPQQPAAPLPGMESKTAREALSESRPLHYEMKDEEDDDMPDDDCDLEEGADPYAYNDQIDESSLLVDYGAPVFTNLSDKQNVVRIMDRLAKEHKLVGSALDNNLVGMAEAAISALGFRIPDGKMDNAIGECIELFAEEKPFPGAAAPFGSDEDDKDDDDKDDDDKDSGKPWEKDDDVAEDQRKGPRIRKRGYAKNSIAPMEVKNESIQWGNAQEDGVLGSMNGVNFIFDHGGDSDLKPVILSEDGSVEIPIPEKLFDSAFASAGMLESTPTNQPSVFADWLHGSIEQLRPISENEDDELDQAIDQAVATIKSNPEGGFSVEVEGDVEVVEKDMDLDSADPDDMDMIELDADPEADDETEGMAAVDSIDADEVDEEEDAEADDNEMPDFESLDDDSDELEEDEDEDEMMEDKDISEPTNAKYTKHVKENPRDMPKHKPTDFSDDKLEDVGPDVKQGDEAGTKPPTAKPMNHK